MSPVEILAVEGRTEGGTCDHILAQHHIICFSFSFAS